jgi:hypothetical protein
MEKQALEYLQANFSNKLLLSETSYVFYTTLYPKTSNRFVFLRTTQIFEFFLEYNFALFQMIFFFQFNETYHGEHIFERICAHIFTVYSVIYLMRTNKAKFFISHATDRY